MNNKGNEINFNKLVDDSKNIDNLFYQNDDDVFVGNNKEFNNINSQNMNVVQEKQIIDIQTEINNNNEINVIVENNKSYDIPIVNNIKEENHSNKFIIFLTNKKVLFVVSILIFVFTLITVGKTIYLRNKVNEYDEFYTEIENKLSQEAIIYQDEKKVDDSLKNSAALELVSCINSSVDINNLPNSVTSVIDEINSYYNQSNNYFSFKYKDIYTGFSVSYNENQNIFTASTIKAPKDIYIYEMASLGKVNLDDKLMYTSKYANTGAWELKKKEFNTEHDIRSLLRYSTVASDNAAHNMLMDYFGRENMLSFWKDKGTTAIFTANNNWGITNSHDATIYMEELYKFYLENEEYGQELMNNFLDSYPKFVKGKNDYKVASKSGWAGSAIHDVSIIFADNPYIVVALSNLGDTDYYTSYFNKVNDLAYKLHTEYWKYKINVCNNIEQY